MYSRAQPAIQILAIRPHRALLNGCLRVPPRWFITTIRHRQPTPSPSWIVLYHGVSCWVPRERQMFVAVLSIHPPSHAQLALVGEALDALGFLFGADNGR